MLKRTRRAGRSLPRQRLLISPQSLSSSAGLFGAATTVCHVPTAVPQPPCSFYTPPPPQHAFVFLIINPLVLMASPGGRHHVEAVWGSAWQRANKPSARKEEMRRIPLRSLQRGALLIRTHTFALNPALCNNNKNLSVVCNVKRKAAHFPSTLH